MKVINIAGKDYTFEFTIEASLYDECTEKTIGLMHRTAVAAEANDMEAYLNSFANIPKATLSMFYAGLLEHHGVSGDNTVPDISVAKKLLATYMKEHKEDGIGDFYSVMETMLEIMSSDGFFNLLGLDKMLGTETQTEKQPKTPQVHKKKTTRVSEK